jgi:hypothetical protein
MNLLVDILFPSKYAKWRIAETKAFIDRGNCDILVNKIQSYANISYDVDYEQMSKYFNLSSFNILIFDPQYNHLNKYNTMVDGTKFNGLSSFSYLFTTGTEFNVDSYKTIYHIFLSNYIKFNKEYTKVPHEKQFIHLYPGGGLGGKEDILKINKKANIISTQEKTDKWLSNYGFTNYISCYGSTCLNKDEKPQQKKLNRSTLTVCFSNMGHNASKGSDSYRQIASTFKKTFPSLNVRFISIGNCIPDANITNYSPKAQVELDEFYNKHVDILINAETGDAFNGWPLGIEAALQGVVLITTDIHNSNNQFKYTTDMMFIIKNNEVDRACNIIKKLEADRKLLHQMSTNIQSHSFMRFDYGVQQQKIFDYLESRADPKAYQIKKQIKDGLQAYRLVCPEFFTEDSVYTINDCTVKFPLITPSNITTLENDVNQLFLNNLENNIPFSFARYNDGEWSPMLKISYSGISSSVPPNHPPYNFKDWTLNESGQKYAEERMLPVIKSKPKYYIGIASQVLQKPYMMSFITPYLKDLQLVDGGLWAKLSINGELIKYFDQFKKRNIIIVGPQYLSKMTKYFKFTHIVTNNNVWDEHDRIYNELKNNVNKIDSPVVLYCCSYVAKTMIDALYHEYKMITQIDIGAALCAYCGINIRPWHKFTPL